MMRSECKLLSDKTDSTEKMFLVQKAYEAFRKGCNFFFCTLQTQPCGQVTGDKQVLWLLFSHLAVLHSTNYDSPAGAIAYMGLLGVLTSGNSGFNSLHPVPSDTDTSYIWFSKNAFLEKKEHWAGYAWQQRLKSDTRSVWTKDYQKKCLISCALQGHGKPRRWDQEPRNQIIKLWDYITNASGELPLHPFTKQILTG